MEERGFISSQLGASLLWDTCVSIKKKVTAKFDYICDGDFVYEREREGRAIREPFVTKHDFRGLNSFQLKYFVIITRDCLHKYKFNGLVGRSLAHGMYIKRRAFLFALLLLFGMRAMFKSDVLW